MNYDLSMSPPLEQPEIIDEQFSGKMNHNSLQSLLKSAKFGFWHWNLETGALLFDNQCIEIVGYSENELPGVIEIRQNLLLGEDRDEVNRIMQDYLEKRIPSYSADFRLIRKDGTIVWVREKGSITGWNEAGKATNFTGVLQDISAEKSIMDLQEYLEQNMLHNERLEADVSAARKKLNEIRRTNAAMFGATPYPAVLFNDKLELIYCNPAALDYFGFSSHIDFITGFMDYMSQIHSVMSGSAENKTFRERLEYVMANGDCSFEIDCELKDRYAAFRTIYRKIPYADSFAICLYMIDLTETKKAQKKLSRQEQMLAAINSIASLLLSLGHDDFEQIVHQSLKTLAECVMVDRVSIWKNYEIDGVLHTSRMGLWSSEKLLKLEAEKVIVNHIPGDIILGDLLPAGKNYAKESKIFTECSRELEELFAPSAEKSGIRSMLLQPILVQGQFWGFIAFANYLSEFSFSAIEKELLLSGGTLVASAIDRNLIAQDLVKARDEARASAIAKSEFLSRMSHELRTPMNAIIGMTSIALTSKTPQKKEYCLEQVDNSSRQLLAIINDILDMSKIEANKFEIEAREFDFEKMLQRVYNVTRVKMDEKQQHFQREWIPFGRMITGDELRISQVLINLISNAIKFTPGGGTITLKVSGNESGDSVKLRAEVTDTGIGIAKEDQGRLFASFEQAGIHTTKQYGGTGLGLAICKKIITLMGGEIWVESEPGKGASFIFEITAGLGRVITEDGPEESGDTQIPENCWKGKTILVVEDVEINREIINTLLEVTGVRMDNAVDGCEALEMYTENPGKYDLILMDIQMPRMDGLEATRRIRELETGGESRRQIPVIAMTANAFTDDVQQCLDAGMNGHLAKPISMTETFALLNKYLGTGAANGCN